VEAILASIWNKSVGYLTWDERLSLATFRYDDNFTSGKWNLSPVVMPLRDTIYYFPENKTACFKGLPGMFADTLPDAFGSQIIDDWFQTRNIDLPSGITPLHRLCYQGKRGMGALEFSPALFKNEQSSIIEIKEMTTLADMIMNHREQFRVDLKTQKGPILDLLKVGTSAGGAKPKAVIAYNPKTKEVRSGQVGAPEGFGYYLLKFDGVENRKLSDNPLGIGNIEYAYHRMAIDCGINMMPCSLYEDGIYNHFMTQRFDRTATGEKLHSQTLAAIAHLDRDLPHSYKSAFSVIRALHLPKEDSNEMFRRMTFNVVARNHDDHTKNHSFIMDRNGTWRLAPAYDLCYAYSEQGRWTSQHQMSINGKRSDFTYNDLIKEGIRNDIRNPSQIIEKTVDIVSRWRTYAMECGVKEAHVKQIESNLILLRQPLQKQKIQKNNNLLLP
jgi:serine/threonine-protein kinase HipA